MLTEGDYWVVNSYGYPNPFSAEDNARRAWQTLLSFYDFTSYHELKQYWESPDAPRRITPHTVESWKATFEEFGLLFVPRGSDTVIITPAGQQFRDAGDGNRREEFGWIGLNLLLRYPLRGPRGRRTGPMQNSDLLLYWFLYAALCDLDGYMWWTELTGAISSTFRVDEVNLAVDNVRSFRANPVFAPPLPSADDTRGRFYNSLNQVIVHAGMNYLLLGNSSDSSLYSDVPERRHWILPEWTSAVEQALGGTVLDIDCEGPASFVQRMPKAPPLAPSDSAYFEYAGARVGPRAPTTPAVSYLAVPGGSVPILKAGVNYTVGAQVSNREQLEGPIDSLCRLAKGQRVVLSHSLDRSYIVEDKIRITANRIAVLVRPGRPITNVQPILAILEANE